MVNLLCVAGGVSFHVYYLSVLAVRRRRKLDSQLYGLLGMIALVTVSIWALAYATDTDLALADSVSLTISAQTTAGFATTDVGSLPHWVLLCLAMFVGGGIGSTSDGIKLGRAGGAGLDASLHRAIIRFSPRDSLSESGGQKADSSFLEDVFAIIGLYFLVLGVSWLCFLAYGFPALASLFEVTSALSTAGLSSGIVAADLPTPLKVVLGFDMLFGRVEVVALLVLFLPGTWIGRRRAS